MKSRLAYYTDDVPVALSYLSYLGHPRILLNPANQIENQFWR